MNDFQRRQAQCQCLPPERRKYIKDALDFTEDFSDGAFMAYMDERGVDVSELECFSVEHRCGAGRKPK